MRIRLIKLRHRGIEIDLRTLKESIGYHDWFTVHDVTDQGYIVEFYSSQRLHSVLGNLPPSVYGRKMAEKEPIVVSEIT